MSVVQVSQVSKSFGSIQAVSDVSFDIRKGEIFGLVGPNGAGKTTLIRLILGIFKPDHGEIMILGGPMDERKKDRIGYMPEERGLYQDIRLEQVLVYLATLKGISSKEARRRVQQNLERFNLDAFRRKKVKELSKGMQQKAQIIATLLHEPELIIVDEPFSGLDPVNTHMVRQLLLDMRAAGRTIVMSTHQMHQVEEMCDRFLLIDHGRVILYGALDQIRKNFAGNAVFLRTSAELPAIEGVNHIEWVNGSMLLTLAAEKDPQALLAELTSKEIPLEKYEIALPSLEQIFVKVVQDQEGIN